MRLTRCPSCGKIVSGPCARCVAALTAPETPLRWPFKVLGKLSREARRQTIRDLKRGRGE